MARSDVEKPHCPKCGMEQSMNVPNPVDEYLTHISECYNV